MKKCFKFLIPSVTALLPFSVMAQTKAATSEAVQPTAILMFSVMGVLLFVIIILARAVFTAYDVHRELVKKANKIAPVILAGLLLLVQPAQAQEAVDEVVEQTAKGPLFQGLSDSSFYMMFAVVLLELFIIFFLVRTFRLFLRLHKNDEAREPATEKAKKNRFSWLEKLNNTKSVTPEAEAAVNLGHDYDGIGELDNPTPPWWQWGFVISVIFSVIYMYTYHVSHSAPNQIQELAIADSVAQVHQAAFLAKAGNNVDENTVKFLSDPADINEGKAIFTSSCAACHGVDGGGTVGPNLTDEYWLHGGSINDVFRTIKYGVPEKGMKSWKDDFSPKKIAQIASYVYSLQGSKPAAPKEPQGEKFERTDAESVTQSN